MIRNAERLLDYYGLGGMYRIGGLSAVLEHIGLTRKQRPAYEMHKGLLVPETEIAAALGVTQAAVSFRLTNAGHRIEQWVADQPSLPDARPAPVKKPYTSLIGREPITAESLIAACLSMERAA